MLRANMYFLLLERESNAKIRKFSVTHSKFVPKFIKINKKVTLFLAFNLFIYNFVDLKGDKINLQHRKKRHIFLSECDMVTAGKDSPAECDNSHSTNN